MPNEIKKIQSLYDEFKEAEQVYEQQIHNNPKYQNAYNKLNVDWLLCCYAYGLWWFKGCIF